MPLSVTIWWRCRNHWQQLPNAAASIFLCWKLDVPRGCYIIPSLQILTYFFYSCCIQPWSAYMRNTHSKNGAFWFIKKENVLSYERFCIVDVTISSIADNVISVSETLYNVTEKEGKNNRCTVLDHHPSEFESNGLNHEHQPGCTVSSKPSNNVMTRTVITAIPRWNISL